MRKFTSYRTPSALSAAVLVFLLYPALDVRAQTRANKNSPTTSERRTARYFESLRKSPPQMYAFLKQMPKGGDLHSHLSGAVYAESYIQWAAAKGLCVNQSAMSIAQPPCDQAAGKPPASAALSNPLLYRQLIDAWSMRYWQYSGQNGHDHFFDTFGKFGGASFGQMRPKFRRAPQRGGCLILN